MPRSCPTCGSKRWRKDAVTGNAVCEEGHVFQDFRSENLDIDPLVGYTLQKRRMRNGERFNKRRELGRANQNLYHGDEAEYLRLQSIQLLLRYQIQALKKLWSLPDVYEAIVRDLWSYQLAISPLPPVPTDDAASQQTAEKPDRELFEVDDDDKEEARDNDDSDKSLEERVDTKEESDDDSELLRRLSEDEDSGKEEEESSNTTGEPSNRWRKRKIVIFDTVVTLVLGLWVLRYPIMNVDLERAMNDNEIPYLDFCNTTVLPSEMRAHMGKELVNALSPRRSPTPLHLFDQSRLTAKILHQKFGISIPALNAPLVIWKTISPLGATPKNYDQVLHLLTMLNAQMSLHNSSFRRVTRKMRGRSLTNIRDTLRRSESDSNFDSPTPLSPNESDDDGVQLVSHVSERATKHHEVILPELAIAAAWIVVMKMAYGLDGLTRHAVSRSEPLTGMHDGALWIEALKKRMDAGELKATSWGLEKHDFTRMNEDDMDAFLRQAENVLLPGYNPDPDASLFPLSSRSSATTQRKASDWSAFHRSTPYVASLDIPPDIYQRQLPLQAGEELRVYDSSDRAGVLPGDMEVVLQAASDVIGVKAEEVLRTVSMFERRLKRIKRESSRSKSRECSTGSGRSMSRSRSKSLGDDLKARVSRSSLRSS